MFSTSIAISFFIMNVSVAVGEDVHVLIVVLCVGGSTDMNKDINYSCNSYMQKCLQK